MKKKNTFLVTVVVLLVCAVVGGVYFLSQDITPQAQQVSQDVPVNTMLQAQSDAAPAAATMTPSAQPAPATQAAGQPAATMETPAEATN